MDSLTKTPESCGFSLAVHRREMRLSLHGWPSRRYTPLRLCMVKPDPRGQLLACTLATPGLLLAHLT
jgi:hypothetical protein